VHGGYGFSEEYDIQLYFRRARALAVLLDDPARECRRLADLLLGPAQASGPPVSGPDANPESDANPKPHGKGEPHEGPDALVTGATA